jgi:hypothetical protein
VGSAISSLLVAAERGGDKPAAKALFAAFITSCIASPNERRLVRFSSAGFQDAFVEGDKDRRPTSWSYLGCGVNLS